MTQGRFPSHLLLSHSMDCTQTDCADGCPVRALDEQSGMLKSGGIGKGVDTNSSWFGKGSHTLANSHPSEGGASRYFQQFRPTTDNPSGDLLQYLVRLITPPDGNVLVLNLCHDTNKSESE